MDTARMQELIKQFHNGTIGARELNELIKLLLEDRKPKTAPSGEWLEDRLRREAIAKRRMPKGC